MDLPLNRLFYARCYCSRSISEYPFNSDSLRLITCVYCQHRRKEKKQAHNSLRSSLRSGLISSPPSSPFSSPFSSPRSSLLSTPISNIYKTPLRATALVVASHANPSDLVGLKPARSAVYVSWEGLCNGTPMVVTRIGRRCLEARILSGTSANQLRAIPRIKLSSTEGELSFIVSRRQFHIRLSFATTVNKSQGQSFNFVSVDLRMPIFTHG